MTGLDPKIKGRPMSEINAIVAADNARFDELAKAWQDLTEREQVELVKWAKDRARSA